MNLPQAQLGSSPGINLGGYIPAARRDPKLWQAALMQMLGNAGGQVLGDVAANALSPNLTETAKAQGVTIDNPHFWQKKQTSDQIAALSGQNTQRRGTDASIKAGVRAGDEAARGHDIETAKVAAEIARDKDTADYHKGVLGQGGEQLAIARRGMALAENKEEFDKWAEQVRLYSGLQTTASNIRAQGVDTGVKVQANKRAEAAAPGERDLTSAQTKNQLAQAGAHQTVADFNKGNGTTGGNQDMILALKGLGLESLSPEKQQAATQAALMVPMTPDRNAYRMAVRQAAAAAAAN